MLTYFRLPSKDNFGRYLLSYAFRYYVPNFLEIRLFTKSKCWAKDVAYETINGPAGSVHLLNFPFRIYGCHLGLLRPKKTQWESKNKLHVLSLKWVLSRVACCVRDGHDKEIVPVLHCRRLWDGAYIHIWYMKEEYRNETIRRHTKLW